MNTISTNDQIIPLVSAVVATYNEERTVERCLRSLLGQKGLKGSVEIIVVDGCSTDKTVEFIKRFPEFGRQIVLVQNPRRLQVFAWNLGLRAARGRYFVTISAHAEYGDDYLANCIETLTRTGADSVGGVQVPVGSGALGKALAWAMQSPFGMGNATFRYAQKEQTVDSVFGGFFETPTILKLGGFDESNPFDEDDDLNYRLGEAGGKIVVSPAIKVHYHVRSSLRALAQQMFRYGFWRRKTQLQYPRRVPVRVLIPPAFVLGLLISALFLLGGSWLGVIVPVVYILFLCIAAAVAWTDGRGKALVGIFLVLPVMHLAYGLGWWSGLIKHRQARTSSV